MRDPPATSENGRGLSAAARALSGVSTSEMLERMKQLAVIQTADAANEPTETEKAQQRSRDDLADKRGRNNKRRRQAWMTRR